MKVKIDEDGWLMLQRQSNMLLQCCPYQDTEGGEGPRCGDWCPLFSEPEHDLTTGRVAYKRALEIGAKRVAYPKDRQTTVKAWLDEAEK